MQRLTAFLTKDGKKYIAVCPELELKIHGKSIDEALNHLWEEMEDLYIEEDLPEKIEVDFLGWKH